jgi:hypothetical protein
VVRPPRPYQNPKAKTLTTYLTKPLPFLINPHSLPPRPPSLVRTSWWLHPPTYLTKPHVLKIGRGLFSLDLGVPSNHFPSPQSYLLAGRPLFSSYGALLFMRMGHHPTNNLTNFLSWHVGPPRGTNAPLLEDLIAILMAPPHHFVFASFQRPKP